MAGGNPFGQFGQSGAPGFVDPFARGAVAQGMGQSVQAMENRYNQLGMPGSTPELMDIGALPSITGGIPEQFAAVLGELQNSSTGGGKPNAASQAGSILNVK